jgi:hypothetical protein
MKIRIQGNSIRFRLSKADVALLSDEGAVTETTSFGKSVFVYRVIQATEGEELSASFGLDTITLQVREELVRDWATNDVVGFEYTQQVSDNENLILLLEKDFKCLDKTTEDQSDNYENPKLNC